MTHLKSHLTHCPRQIQLHYIISIIIIIIMIIIIIIIIIGLFSPRILFFERVVTTEFYRLDIKNLKHWDWGF